MSDKLENGRVGAEGNHALLEVKGTSFLDTDTLSASEHSKQVFLSKVLKKKKIRKG